MVSFKNHFNPKWNAQAEHETKPKSHSGTNGESVYKTEKTI